MVDRTNPTSQFHPYQPPDAIPHEGRTMSGSGNGISDILGKVGIDASKFGAITDKLNGMDVRGGLGKARTVAQNNGGLVLGGLAALAIGAGLMRRRSMSTK